VVEGGRRGQRGWCVRVVDARRPRRDVGSAAGSVGGGRLVAWFSSILWGTCWSRGGRAVLLRCRGGLRGGSWR